MFSAARIKLTLGYTFFFAIVIILFSSVFFIFQQRVIYQSRQLPQRVTTRIERRFPRLDQDEHDEVSRELRDRFESVTEELLVSLLNTILWLDLVAILFCFVVSYILAGLTLQPIEKAFLQQRQFLQDASHELRTPLAVMRAEVEVALRARNNKLSQKSKSLLESMLEELEKMSSLVSDIMFLARSEQSGDEKFEQNPDHRTNISAAVKKVVKSFSSIAKQKGVILETTGFDRPIGIAGTSSEWEQVLRILVDNALKYTSQGRVEISLGKRTFSAKSGVVLKVTDTGIGMSNRDQKHIFNRFYRAESARVANGFGLGLAIAVAILKKFGGQISIVSKLGQGSVFTVCAPAKSLRH